MTILQVPARGFDIQQWHGVFSAARLPGIAWQRSLVDDAAYKPALDYVNSRRYGEDSRDGIGVMLTGSTSVRVRVFPLLARAMIVKEDSVFYISLVDLVHALVEDGHKLYDPATAAHALFVTGMGDGDEFPFEKYHRRLVQGFLTKRFEQGLRNIYSTPEGLRACGWWSDEFVEYQSQYLRELKV